LPLIDILLNNRRQKLGTICTTEKMPGGMDVIVRASIVDKAARNDACAPFD
jgi:hypothetical protein